MPPATVPPSPRCDPRVGLLDSFLPFKKIPNDIIRFDDTRIFDDTRTFRVRFLEMTILSGNVAVVAVFLATSVSQSYALGGIRGFNTWDGYMGPSNETIFLSAATYLAQGKWDGALSLRVEPSFVVVGILVFMLSRSAFGTRAFLFVFW